MTVLKHNEPAATHSRAVVLDLSDLGEQAQRLLASARAEAQQILAEAKEQAQHLREHAQVEGLREGTARGEQEGRSQGAVDARQELMESLKPQLEQITESWGAALQHWDQQRNNMLLQAREDVLAFAFDLAAKVIGRIIEHDPTVVHDQLHAALQLLNQPTAITIVVHPADEPLVQEVLPELMQQIGCCEHATITTDDTVDRGGCLVRTAGGSIDATIETQLQRLSESLLPAKRSVQESPSSHIDNEHSE